MPRERAFCPQLSRSESVPRCHSEAFDFRHLACLDLPSEEYLAQLKDMGLTIIAAITAAGIVAAAALLNFDLVTVSLPFLERIEKHKVDDMLAGFVLIVLAVAIDLWRRRKRHQREIEEQKLRTLKATMRTVQDIVNNFLNNLLLFEMDMQANVPPRAFEQLDELARQTYEKLKALGDLQEVRECSLAVGAGIEYPQRVSSCTTRS